MRCRRSGLRLRLPSPHLSSALARRAVVRRLSLLRRVFTIEIKAEVARHKKAGNPGFAGIGRKFDVLSKRVQRWEKQYAAGQLTVAAGRRAISPEQAENLRLRAELSRARMEVSILMAQGHVEKAAAYFAKESL